MGGICLAAALLTATLPLQTFTLAWTHSIEKIRWEEDYRLDDGRLLLTEARIKGSGAGMEAPDGARLERGVWRYRPALAPLARLRLAHSPYADDYEICAAGNCRPLASLLPGIGETAVVELVPCASATSPAVANRRRH